MARENQLSAVAIGPQKTATTWLAQALAASEGYSLPTQVKETFFWDRNFAKGEGWYFRHFHRAGLATEVGPTYFHAPEATARLKAHNPALKIVVTLRDPADRAYSLYLHHVRKGRTQKKFREAIADFPEIIVASQYGTHLQRWLETFGSAQVLVLLQDDIRHAPRDVLRKVAVFLGHEIDVSQLDVTKRVNAGAVPLSHSLAAIATSTAEGLRALRLYPVINFAKAIRLKKLAYGSTRRSRPPMGLADRAWLVTQFEDDIRYVENHLSTSLETWRQVEQSAS